MSMIGVDYGVLNQKGSPSWFSDIYANIPTAGYKGRMFISIDTYAFYRDTGTGWDLIGGPGTGTITGSGTSGQVSYFNGSSTLAGSNNLFWDITNSRLGIGTATPGASLDIHSTGTNAQFNGTGSNNAYIVFQQAGTSKWRIGNTFSSPNSFDIYNNATTTNALSISSSNILSFVGVSNFDEVIRLKQNLLSYATSSGYTTMFSTTGGGLYTLGFYNGGGALSQISFTTAASYSYVFPSASGTLALTSALGDYVTLATTQTITGAKTFNDYQIFTNAITANSGIAFLNGVMPPITSSYYSGIGGNSQGVSIVTRPVSTNYTNNLYFASSSNTFTFPNATGTLALTTDLGAYLPLAGGTLTGQLYINPTNTGITGLDVASDTIRFRSDNLEGFKRQLEITMGSGTLVQLTAKGYLANYGTDMAFYTATTGGTNASPGIYITGTNNRVGIKTGTPSYDLDVSGTFGVSSAATFSSSVDATIFNSTSNAFRFSGSNAISLVTLSSQNVVKINAAGYWGVQLVGANDTGILIGNTGNVMIGSTTDNGNKLQVNGNIVSDAGYFLGNKTATISALNTSVLLYSGAVSGIITLRDNTNGGSIAWLQDPNGGNITLANNLVNGSIIIFQSAGNTYIQKTSGNVPIIVQYAALLQ